jgi:hypothetical protein
MPVQTDRLTDLLAAFEAVHAEAKGVDARRQAAAEEIRTVLRDGFLASGLLAKVPHWEAVYDDLNDSDAAELGKRPGRVYHALRAQVGWDSDDPLVGEIRDFFKGAEQILFAYRALQGDGWNLHVVLRPTVELVFDFYPREQDALVAFAREHELQVDLQTPLAERAVCIRTIAGIDAFVNALTRPDVPAEPYDDVHDSA